MDVLIRRLVHVLAIVATLYHLYLVVHPYTPLSSLHVSLLDLTQVQRATHVFLIALLGYWVCIYRLKARSFWGALPLLIMTGFFTYEFVRLDLPWFLKVAGCVVWALTMVSVAVAQVSRYANVLCGLLSILPFVYLVATYEKLIYRAIMPEPWDLFMAFSEVLLVLGVIFRLSGPIMPTLVMIFILYNLYGEYIPGTFANPGFSIDMLLGKMYCETEAGIFGAITGVSLKYLIYFTTLGAVVTHMGFGKIIANIALLLVGRSPASPGRASSVMAVLMGMFSGSGAADTQFVATLTRPLFDQVRYNRLVAAGVIATVGSIAYITPPVMGSVSFIMVELLSIPYSTIILMATGPMLLYLLGILLYNELYVRREGLPHLKVASTTNWAYFWRYSYVFIPILVIITLIYRGFAINLTVSVAIGLFLLFAYADNTLRPPVTKIWEALEEGTVSLLHIASAVIAANMIMSMMVLSGLASKFSIVMLKISGSSMLLAALFTGVFSLILGMGVPPIATYVLTSALTAPAIQKLAIMTGIPEGPALLATHMFLFYFAVLAEVTPPVALSAYAAGAVMGTDPIKTGVFSARVALPKYFIGLTFILSFSGTALLIAPVTETLSGWPAFQAIALRYLASLGAVIFLNVGVVGYLFRRLSTVERWISGICGLLLFYPHLWFNAVSASVALVVGARAWLSRPRVAEAHPM
ncbi:TRAP transporter permease [Desulfosoma caldarium]|uniref:TRAP transporter 4TM/12TM fusion protein n=1 Tax=Desulfosoma caldarium TaxID=610254 RepID=A0A3N1UQK5_9BACT|nr:TRAP transporter fused permease subunit [Desulfosoma caldarium]ROQ92018.1 TRAP transporter 4TM/12TM fusion protein [Desulfosoma caldarium]